MKKGKIIAFSLVLIFIAALLFTSCSNNKNASINSEELILGKTAFGASFSVKKASKEAVTFIVEPFADKSGRGSNSFEMSEGVGIFGGDALIEGIKKGSEATLDGSFTIYANDKNGPSVTINVEGVYEIDEEGYCETDDYMFYYLYKNGEFIKSDRETVISPYNVD